MATALLWWFFVVPDVETMKTLGWGWALWLYAVNAAAIFVFYGTFELIYYVKRKQADALQVQCAFPRRSPLGRVLVQEPEPRQFPAQLLRHHTAVDRGRGLHAVGVRQWLGDLAELGRSSGLPGGAGAGLADDPRGAFLLHPPPDPLADRSTAGSIRSTTIRSIPRRGRRCRCTRSKGCSITPLRCGTW